jgi:integrase
VNWERGTVHIAQTVIADKHDRGAAKIQPRGKTAAASRQVKLTSQTVAMLAEHRDRQRFVRQAAGDRWQEHDLIISTSIGTSINPANVSRSFNSLVKAAGVPRIRVHDLRHTAASLMLRAGVPVKQISERLGHANVRITLDTYAHLMADAHDLAAEAMSRILNGDTEATGTDV